MSGTAAGDGNPSLVEEGTVAADAVAAPGTDEWWAALFAHLRSPGAAATDLGPGEESPAAELPAPGGSMAGTHLEKLVEPMEAEPVAPTAPAPSPTPPVTVRPSPRSGPQRRRRRRRQVRSAGALIVLVVALGVSVAVAVAAAGVAAVLLLRAATG